MNGSPGNQSAVFPFFFRGWLSKIQNFLLVRPLKLVFFVLFLLPFFIYEGFNNDLFLRFEIFVERVWQVKGECYLRRPLPYSLLVFCALLDWLVREPHTRHHDSWISIIHLRGPFFQGFHCTFHFLIHFHLHNVDFTKSWRIIAEYFLKLTMNQLQSLLHDSLIATGHIQHCAIIRRKDTSLRASTVGFSVSVSL